MKETTNTIYHCEHCKKKLFVKHAMLRHEERCHKNPENNRACFGCIHLEMQTPIIYHDNPMGGEIEQKVNALFCNKLKHFLIPPKAEHRGNAYEFGDFSNEIMPKECDDLEITNIMYL